MRRDLVVRPDLFTATAVEPPCSVGLIPESEHSVPEQEETLAGTLVVMTLS